MRSAGLIGRPAGGWLADQPIRRACGTRALSLLTPDMKTGIPLAWPSSTAVLSRSSWLDPGGGSVTPPSDVPDGDGPQPLRRPLGPLGSARRLCFVRAERRLGVLGLAQQALSARGNLVNPHSPRAVLSPPASTRLGITRRVRIAKPGLAAPECSDGRDGMSRPSSFCRQNGHAAIDK